MGDASNAPQELEPEPAAVPIVLANELHEEEDNGWGDVFFQINRNGQVPERAGVTHWYRFRNITVEFPYEAYRSQMQMMGNILNGVTTNRNCLLESPTGTGKTAALLCSLLAWQGHYRAGNFGWSATNRDVEGMRGCFCGFIRDPATTNVEIRTRRGVMTFYARTPNPPPQLQNQSAPNNSSTSTSSEAEFRAPTTSPVRQNSTSTPPRSFRSRLQNNGETATSSESLVETLSTCSVVEKTEEDLCTSCTQKYVQNITERKPPQIYYCTRTHTQIAQVIKELKKTFYKDANMTILGSREVSCISSLVERENVRFEQLSVEERINEQKVSVNEICKKSRENYFKIEGMQRSGNPNEQAIAELRRDVCSFYRRRSELKDKFLELQQEGAWDIEDSKNFGRGCRKCPYYGNQAIRNTADIVFCSYNYLIDATLRSSSYIDCHNTVIVFDEAHNIEDACRDAFSFTIDTQVLDKDVREPIEKLLQANRDGRAVVNEEILRNFEYVSGKILAWSTWLKIIGARLRVGEDEDPSHDPCETFESETLLNAIREMGITGNEVKGYLRKIGHDYEAEGIDGFSRNARNGQSRDEENYYFDGRGERRPFKVPSKVGELLKRLVQPLLCLCRGVGNGIGGVQDFNGRLTRVLNPAYERNANENGHPNGLQTAEYIYRFDLICLNPALAFKNLRDSAYSVIVTSGSLCPLSSFEGELGTEFFIKLVADHVIPSTNVWAGTISKLTPQSSPLCLNLEKRSIPEIQDDVGEMILQICNTIPNGILVFFPSYLYRNEIIQRWKENPTGSSVYSRIERIKYIFVEDSRDRAAFARDMIEYKEKVRGDSSRDGCILFAVFRGKVSEGIDFANEMARAVITVGIPYAAKSISKPKQSYNDSRNSQSGSTSPLLLSGREWYNNQTFRAMNQGLGRCVRHLEDWGAIIMIDDRLTDLANKYISTWIRSNLRLQYTNFSQVIAELTVFVRNMQERREHSSRLQNGNGVAHGDEPMHPIDPRAVEGVHEDPIQRMDVE